MEKENCPGCGVKPGEAHKEECKVEQCTVCHGQRVQCDCEGHDSVVAKWTGELSGKYY